jgi:mRNA-degrading endonuclease YafQ of YafQ-DinJ toxin-antitoxin module
VSYQYQATETFWQNFYSLSDPQKESVRRAWLIFKQNPFDPRLRPHKIHSLSARYKKTIHSVAIEGDLRVVFYIEDDKVWTVDIGTHALYR